METFGRLPRRLTKLYTDTKTTCDGAPCVRYYASPAGINQNFIDLAAFPD